MAKEFLIVFSALVNLGLGFIVYRKEKKNAINRSFFLFTINVFIWSIALFFYVHPILFTALDWMRITYFCSAFLPATGFYFLAIFSGKTPGAVLKLLNYYWLLISPLILILFLTDWWVVDIISEPWGYHTVTGPAYPFFGILVGFYSLWAFVLFFQKYKRSKNLERAQAQYMLMGLVLFGLSGFLVDIILPVVSGTSKYFWTSPISSLFFVGFTTLAITRYHLFEIKVVLTEMLVGVMGIILAGEIFMFENFQTKIFGFGIFLLFCFTGYLLVRATRQEIKKREEVEKLANRLKEASKNIEELSRMKTEFLKVVNHQLRTPVTIIKGMLSMMVEGTVKGKELNEYIKKTYFSSERLTTILDDILLAQRLIGKTEEMLLQPCQIEEITQRVVDHLETQAEMKGLRILFKKPKSPIPVTLADEEKVERALSRLIDNAILYTAKGKIEVSLALRKKEEKDFIQISIKDQGIGLTKEDKKDLFKLFHRGERATLLHPNGSGLGLFIVKNLVEAHQGQIEARSKGKDKGTTFIITLPVVSEI